MDSSTNQQIIRICLVEREKIMDRRKKKTQKAIRKVMLELLDEKNIEAISILDITNQADINRGTFYLHYVDKYDMLEKFENELFSKIEEILYKNIIISRTNQDFLKSRYPTLVQFFDCLKEERDLFLIVLKTDGIMTMQSKLIQIIHSLLQNEKISNIPITNNKRQLNLFIPILVSILLSVAQYWINNEEEKEITSEQIARAMFNILLNGPAKATGLLEGDMIDIDEFLQLDKE